MTAEEVAQFFRTHPQFFDQHPELLESIFVTHPYGGRAIPLAERQILSLREKVKLLEGKLAELIRFGEANDAISEKVHRLAMGLAAARDFAAAVQALHFHLREDFSVPHVALRLWGRALPADAPEAAPVEDALRAQVEAMGAPQCGPAAASPFLAWFGDAREHIRSLALVPLGQTRAVGLLALGSEDAQRFYAEMGTLYLRRIGELTAAALAARL
ncbi:MAG: DUF484 family protein [Betaproteobacteria bacterium]|nr:DUF484 family protein [Betaproteobacteria bacterium]MDH5222177.1 DUF484 family protein [Betaproteobacteria bacterium]MDH5350942.1 DUF484 family protein [Betaproteobacteria bacterium]